MEELAREFHGPVAMASTRSPLPIFWLALAGVVLAWFFYLRRPDIPAALKRRFALHLPPARQQVLLRLVQRERACARRAPAGTGCGSGGDVGIIDGILIDGSARTVGGIAASAAGVQSGYLYWYALVMIVGVIGLMTWQLWPFLGGLFGTLTRQREQEQCVF